jgi:uncharacterized membrane protein (DUF2068 family)
MCRLHGSARNHAGDQGEGVDEGNHSAVEAMALDLDGRTPTPWFVPGGNRPELCPGGLRIVSLFEAAKGLLVLLAGFGVLALIHEDLHQVAKELVRHFHLNPASHYPHIFIKASKNWNDGYLLALAGSALFYAMVRFVEAFGLWRQRRWAAWFGLLSGVAYVPIELFEITQGVTWPKLVLLIVNAGVVAYLGYALYRTNGSYRENC